MDKKMDRWMDACSLTRRNSIATPPLNIKAVSPQCAITSLSTDGLKYACQIIRLRASIALRHCSLPHIYYIHIEQVAMQLFEVSTLCCSRRAELSNLTRDLWINPDQL